MVASVPKRSAVSSDCGWIVPPFLGDWKGVQILPAQRHGSFGIAYHVVSGLPHNVMSRANSTSCRYGHLDSTLCRGVSLLNWPCGTLRRGFMHPVLAMWAPHHAVLRIHSPDKDLSGTSLAVCGSGPAGEPGHLYLRRSPDPLSKNIACSRSNNSFTGVPEGRLTSPRDSTMTRSFVGVVR